MTVKQLEEQILGKKSLLCVGLDPDPTKIPGFLHRFDDPVFEFNRRIIDATAEYCVAYKLNTAFYEARGTAGWESLFKTARYIPEGILKIADAKRGDIGNTSAMYAKAFFEAGGFDAVTVNPYMGEDSVKPFLNFKDKWTILLGLTSNSGSNDFQKLQIGSSDRTLYEEVILKSREWGSSENMMYVAGATHTKELKKIRALLPDHFLLVPGVGAQGGSVRSVLEATNTPNRRLLINVSRAIVHASSGENFAEEAAHRAQNLVSEMSEIF